MAIVSYDRAAAVHATTDRPRLVWGRLFALAFALGSWAAIIAGVRAIL
ncbi:hypothetical protein [Caulobacter segnis]|uniref:Uncharacterized protein n=1 Tax=Caulobacter segnis (strain ATCC 21756 / DSM 7131 / JCM 7823 / NBRC 15250 / LMG 17158 / TK0059) TaxID=509190 RepID=D5VHD7_CAUST|nr:hypothetical protein [Caulobacter segnis]ADG08795.1 conserved hypothetical protein [Caulobacter segnis ATCC 21756]